MALSSIASAISTGTETTKQRVKQLLDYCATHPDTKIRFKASDMILRIHSDASYLSEPNARSRAGGYFYLGNKQEQPHELPNGAVHVVATIIKQVVASAAEAELAALFINAKDGAILRTTLEEMGHPQTQPTPIQTDNSTAFKIANNTCKQQRSKAMDMRYYWVQDRVAQKQFNVYWKPGTENYADYYTKHHAPIHHQRMRPIYLYVHGKQPTHTKQALRGCVKTPVPGDTSSLKSLSSASNDSR